MAIRFKHSKFIIMQIKYADYLLKSCEDKIISSLSITDPRSIGNSYNIDMMYELRHDLECLEKQADVFLMEFRRNPKLSKQLDNLLSLNHRYREEVIKRTYIYSYFKTICIIRDIIKNNFRSIGILPANSYVYYGHKKLIYTFLSYNISSHTPSFDSTVMLQKILTYKSLDNFKIIENSDHYKKLANEYYPFGIFNADCERVLEILSELDSISVEQLDKRETISVSSKENPLGNMCYVKSNKAFGDNTFINSVTIRDSLTDHVSKFWNIANCIHLSTIDERFDGEFPSPYFSTNINSLNNNCYFAMVESITGMKCGASYSNYGSSSIQGSPKDSSDKPSGNPGNPNPKKREPKWGKSNKQSSPDSKIISSVKSVMNKIGSVATSDQVKSLVADAAKMHLKRSLDRQEMERVMASLKNEKLVITNTDLRANLLPIASMKHGTSTLGIESKT